jgi:hypothetical protein
MPLKFSLEGEVSFLPLANWAQAYLRGYNHTFPFLESRNSGPSLRKDMDYIRYGVGLRAILLN